MTFLQRKHSQVLIRIPSHFAAPAENRLRAIRNLPTVAGNPTRLRVVKSECRSPIRSKLALVSHARRNYDSRNAGGV
jgi:hypothetical protein